jgi:hypothetical protein
MAVDPDGGSMKVSFVEPLSRAVERMRRILLEPFDFVKWLVLGFSAWLAGLASSGGGGGGTYQIYDDEAGHSREIVSNLDQVLERLVSNFIMLPLVLLLISAILVVVLLVFWVSSRAKFIFLDNVVHNRAEIVEPWKRFKRLGNSLFLWRLGFLVGCIAAALAVMLVFFAPAATMSLSDALEALSIAAIVMGVIVVMVFSVIAAFVLLLLENFVIPIMYRFDLKATEAWRAFLPWLRSYGGYFVMYGLVVLLVAIPAFLVYWVLCCCTCCIVAIPYIGTVILLPVWVSYRCFGPEFLAQFDSSFDLFSPVPVTPAALREGESEPESS